MSQVFIPSTLTPRCQPFLYITATLAVGILLDRSLQPPRLIVAALTLVFVAISITLVLREKKTSASIALMVSFAFAGAQLALAERTIHTSERLDRLFESRVISADDPVELTGTLAAPPEPAPKAYYLDAEAKEIRIRGEAMAATGRVRLSLSIAGPESQLDFDRLALDYGSSIRVLVRLERGRSYANPGSPDFNDFLERRGYDLEGAIKSPLLIERLDEAPRNEALAVLYHLRLRIMKALDSSFNPRVAGTLKAMLAGNRYFLDHVTVERLREGSTFHTLVIAGLHIGIVAWALLGGRSALKRRATWRVIVCLLVLWSYAIMVGLAPPVTRATMMISVGLLGPLLFRRSASINTVALAAFVMLALKPALVADPGFQLSFVAVAGIVALALPLVEKFRIIGEWRPASHTPHPPSCHRTVRYVAETLFWDDRAFNEEMRRSPIRYRLEKAAAARLLGRWRVQRLVRAIVSLTITSSAIQLTTLPLMALYFNRVAPVGVLLNIVAGLLTGVLMLTALGAIAAGAFNVWIGAQLGRVVYAAHYLLINSIGPFAGIPMATFRVAHYEGWHSIIYALYYAPLAMLAVLIGRWHPVDQVLAVARPRTDRASLRRQAALTRAATSHSGLVPPLFCALAMTAALIAVVRPPVVQTSGKLTVHFLDVGQGDSALVIFPHGKTMLVDGGGELRFDRRDQNQEHAEGEPEDDEAFADSSFSIGEAVVSRFIWSLGRTRVDYVLATHAHADHIGGLSDVVGNFQIGQAIVGHVPAADPEYDRFAEAARRRGVLLSRVSAGESFEIDGVTIEVLWPLLSTYAPETSGNNDSVVLRLVYGAVSILLAGDVEREAEDSLVASGMNLSADVLKVPHHGSRTSSTEAFIDAVHPRYAVISVGERSRFGHPHPAVVNRYLTRDVKLYRTGVDGMVTLETDGSALDIRTFRK